MSSYEVLAREGQVRPGGVLGVGLRGGQQGDLPFTPPPASASAARYQAPADRPDADGRERTPAAISPSSPKPRRRPAGRCLRGGVIRFRSRSDRSATHGFGLPQALERVGQILELASGELLRGWPEHTVVLGDGPD